MFLFNLLVLFFFALSGPLFAQHSADSLDLAQSTTAAYELYLANPDSSIVLSTETLARAIQGKNKYFQGFNYFVLSKAYWAKANYRLSTEFGFKALKIFENSPHVYLWGETVLALARTLIDLKNFDRAKAFMTNAMNIAVRQSNDKLLADVFREQSFLLLEEQKYDSALLYADKGIALYETYGDTLNASILFGRKARIYLSLGDYETSMALNQKALLLDSLMGNRRALGVSYFQSAQGYYYLKQDKKSISLLKKSIVISNEIRNLSSLIKAHTFLSDIYLAQAKPSLAVKELQIISQLKDSLYSTERNGQIQEMQSLYELENKENTIQLLEQENALKKQQVKNQRFFTVFLLVSILLLLLLIFVLWRLRVLQKKGERYPRDKKQSY